MERMNLERAAAKASSNTRPQQSRGLGGLSIPGDALWLSWKRRNHHSSLCRDSAGPWQKQGEREWLQARQGEAAEDSAVAAASSLPTAHFLGVLLL